MWVLIKHEFKRFFKNKFIMLLLISMVLINLGTGIAMKSYSVNNDFYDETKIHSDFLEEYNPIVEDFKDKLNNNVELSDIDQLTYTKANFLSEYHSKAIYCILKKDNAALLENELNYGDFVLKDFFDHMGDSSYESIVQKEKVDVEKLQLNTSLYRYMYENNIKLPFRAEYYPSGLNLTLFLLKNVYVLLLPIIIIFLSASAICGELDNNTFKLLFTQPVSKFKILLSKILVSLSLSFIFLLVILMSSLIIGTILTEFGDVNYPVAIFNNTSMAAVDKYQAINFASISSLGMILLQIIGYLSLIIPFITLLSVFVSSVCKNKISSNTILLIGTIILYLFSNNLPLGREFNPVTYINTYNVITGTYTLTHPTVSISLGIIIMISIALLSTIFSILKCKKLTLD